MERIFDEREEQTNESWNNILSEKFHQSKKYFSWYEIY
jgi:hypothetical protein